MEDYYTTICFFNYKGRHNSLSFKKNYEAVTVAKDCPLLVGNPARSSSLLQAFIAYQKDKKSINIKNM